MGKFTSFIRNFKIGSVVVGATTPEINNFWGQVLINEDILGFEVPMKDPLRKQKAEPFRDTISDKQFGFQTDILMCFKQMM